MDRLETASVETPFAAYRGSQPYVFVCYAHKDRDVVYPELSWLRDQGVNIWYDEGISGGRVWRAQIGDAIKGAAKLFFYVSSASLVSDHCGREIDFGLDEGVDIVPIFLEDVPLTTDLKLALGRVQALMRFSDSRYRQHLLEAAHAFIQDEASLAALEKKLWRKRAKRWAWGCIATLILAALVWRFAPDNFTVGAKTAVRLGITPFEPPVQKAAGLEYELERRLSASRGLLVRVDSSVLGNQDYHVSGTTLGDALRLELQDRNGVRVAAWTTDLNRDLSEVADSVSRFLLIKLGRAADVVSRFQQVVPPDVFRTYLAGTAQLRGSHTLAALLAAESAFNSVLEAEPHFAPAHAGLCSTYLHMYTQLLEEEKFKQAEQHCHRALTLDEENATVHMALGMLYRETGQTPKAIDSFHRALALAPYYTDAMRGLAATLDRSGVSAEANHWYMEAILVEPGHWENYQALGIHLFMNGDFMAAIESFQTALSLAPDELGPVNNIGAAWFMVGDFDKAVTYWRRVAEREPGPQVYANLANSFFYQGEFARARSMYESAHSAAPADYRYLGHIGEVVYITEPAAAATYFRQAIELGLRQLEIDPENALTLSNVASYYAGLGERDYAETLLDQALSQGVGDVDVVYNAAVSYTRLGERALALAQLEQLITLGYEESLLLLDANFTGLYSSK